MENGDSGLRIPAFLLQNIIIETILGFIQHLAIEMVMFQEQHGSIPPVDLAPEQSPTLKPEQYILN